MNPLVSIITPCYNGEAYVAKFLDSVLAQTYPNIELLIVNDGSKDRTEEIILSYKPKFEAKGYSLIYIKQKNAGQSAAINKALLKFKGEYMTWPDSDDLLTPDAIDKKVAYMEAHPDKGMCICKTKSVDFATGKMLGILQRIPPVGEDLLYEDLILGKNVYYSPGGYMVRSSMFREAMGKPLQIVCPRECGQNYQLMLPIAFKYPCGYLDDILYIYNVRADSHSHKSESFEQKMKNLEIGIDVQYEVTNKIKMTDEQRIETKRLIKIHHYMVMLAILEAFKRKDNITNIKINLRNLRALDRHTKYRIICIKYKSIWLIRAVYINVKKFVKRIFDVQ